MADTARPCSLIPYTVGCCCGPQNGISAIQPDCQELPNGEVVNNPAYVEDLNSSFWSYKFLTDCAGTTRAISNFVIPICQSIHSSNIIVEEKLDGTGSFTQVPFTLSTTDPNFGAAPSGFQWLKVEVSGRYDKGISVEYRLTLVGNYPEAIQPIKVKAATSVITFNCDCFLVPECNPEGKLAVNKESSVTIVNNKATLNYSVRVSNIGNAALNNVQFLDTIFIPSQLTIGTITVNPNTLVVDRSTVGQVKISGNLGTINPGAFVDVTYTIPINNFSQPGIYTINNTALATALNTSSSDSTELTINVAEVSTIKCCIVSDRNHVDFRILLLAVPPSPSVLVDFKDGLFIPAGITVQFTDFSGCNASFVPSGNPVPLDTNITGPANILVTCTELNVPSDGAVARHVRMRIISDSVVGTSTISNSITDVTPTNPGAQIFLGAGTLPATAEVQVNLSLDCLNPCPF
ncbi:hypothetical protein [Clostridium paridis]|uniref:DUF11 domain-containing protein n=1 Tax=Clostridium paridis TaxID=2803863 RepID=A0A937K6C3_9CLOT|nr:hypothetical protein [Clostridium paridis]MBL4933480.1 hypothetical protein [Clostridium paridis]